IDMSVLMFMLDYQYNIKARVGVQCSKMANDHYESYPGGIRFSMGYFNTDRQVDYLIESIKSAIKSC
ncbi:MAG: aminotransferase class V-fold PLP-dependent enzyme, partial [Peptostreptococcus anaerobius]